jgi:hypothetical protein
MDKYIKPQNQNKGMKKGIVLALVTAIFLISLVSAEVEYFQYKSYKGNNLFLDHLFFCYQGGTDNYVSGGHFFEAYIQYNIFVQKFNAENPSEPINNCNLVLKQSSGGNLSIIVNRTYTNASYDAMNEKYFFTLSDGDCVMAQIYCRFEPYVNASGFKLDTSETMQLVTPTWECKACQKYEWTAEEQNSIKAESLGDYVIVVSDYIKKLFMLNYEIVLALFWIFLIFMLLAGVGLIFMGVYYLYLYLSHIVT